MPMLDWRPAAAILVTCVLGGVQAHAADMRIVNLDASDEGLNNPASVMPVGDNDGETLGAQRRIALQYAADILGDRIGSSVPIRIAAQFDELECAPNAATLGDGSPAQYSANFSDQPRPNTFYPLALANALAGRRIAADRNDIVVRFTSTIDDGDPDCLQGNSWYYGLDNDNGANQIDFARTAVHELLHGLGFISLVALRDTDGSAIGQFPRNSSGDRLPDIYSRFIKDLSIAGQPLWPALSDAQRADSITNGPDVVWSDANTANAAAFLTGGLNQGHVRIYAPPTIAPGSSISHWDPALEPDQLMEPVATGRHEEAAGIGLAACVLENIGWQLINGTRCPDSGGIADPDDANPDDNGTTELASDSAGSDDNGGGGCTVASEARFDPLWPLMLVGALVLGRRRLRRG